jgi:thiamine pyrophosphate-dependent acetolactate synthase large subunit-like protein
MDGGHRVAEALARRGVRVLFTLCGGHISPILVGAKDRGIRVVDVRDEASAVFAADATARLGGVPGVAAVTAGPGVTNTITAVKNAALAQSPVVLLGGAVPTVLEGRGALQDIDQRALIRPHVKWVARVRRARDLGPSVEQAFARASEGVPGPVFVECPVDLLYDQAVVREWYAAGTRGPARGPRARLERWYLERHLARMVAGPFPGPASSPSPTAASEPGARAVQRAAAALIRATRPVLLVGSQAMLRPERATALGEAIGRLGMPTYLSGMARGLLGRRHALQLRHQRKAALREADLVILAGVPCDFRLDYGRHIARGAVLIAANRSAREARRNRRPEVAAIGDVCAFLEALATMRGGLRTRWDPWLAGLRARDAARDAEIREQAALPGGLVNPLALCRAIDAIAQDDSVFVLDGGDFAATASYIVAPRAPLCHLDPGVFGTLGVGGGFALGAKLQRPDSEVWILYGDGACAYSLAEFDTFARHGLPVIAVVGNDAGWTQIAREQEEILKDDVGTVLRHTDYHVVAAGYGGRGLLVRRPDEVDHALREAQAAARGGQPALVNVLLDRTEFRRGSISM